MEKVEKKVIPASSFPNNPSGNKFTWKVLNKEDRWTANGKTSATTSEV